MAVREVKVCTAGECGGECYRCRTLALRDLLEHAETELQEIKSVLRDMCPSIAGYADYLNRIERPDSVTARSAEKWLSFARQVYQWTRNTTAGNRL